jgi:hypothetical protein
MPPPKDRNDILPGFRRRCFFLGLQIAARIRDPTDFLARFFALFFPDFFDMFAFLGLSVAFAFAFDFAFVVVFFFFPGRPGFVRTCKFI